jgi:hypothetical protein
MSAGSMALRSRRSLMQPDRARIENGPCFPVASPNDAGEAGMKETTAAQDYLGTIATTARYAADSDQIPWRLCMVRFVPRSGTASCAS